MPHKHLPAVLMLLGLLAASAPTHAQTRALLLAHDDTSALADALQDRPDIDIEAISLGIDPPDPAIFEGRDVVIVWTNFRVGPPQSAALGDALADFSDRGGGVVELVYSQFAPEQIVAGRWREDGYACVQTAGANLETTGSLGRVDDPVHPIMVGVEALTANQRTGDATLAMGAERIASYEDLQILAAIRDDKPGRVVWLGFYPGTPDALGGDWDRLLVQASDWAAERSDRDADGTPNLEDNCPDDANPEQQDADNDAEGDACDDDIDGDGLDNAQEDRLGTDPNDPDSDGDGLDDGDEQRQQNTNPLEPDSDRDGIDDGDEVDAGTNPNDADSDGDGLDDGDEVDRGLDPLDADSDGDNLNDGDEIDLGTDPKVRDSDAGGRQDGDEVALGLNPLDPSDDRPQNPDHSNKEACGCAQPTRPAPLPAPLAVLIAAAAILWRRP